MTFYKAACNIRQSLDNTLAVEIRRFGAVEEIRIRKLRVYSISMCSHRQRDGPNTIHFQDEDMKTLLETHSYNLKPIAAIFEPCKAPWSMNMSPPTT